MRKNKRTGNWILAAFLVLAMITSFLLLTYTFFHTGDVLATYINPRWVGYTAAFGIELGVLILSIMRAMRQVEKGFINISLGGVLFVSAIAQVYGGYHARYGEPLTWQSMGRIDPVGAIVGISVTALIPLLIFTISETFGISWHLLAVAVEKAFSSSTEVVRLTPVTIWPSANETVTYFMQADNPTVVKIGITNNLRDRVGGIQTAASLPVVVAAWITGDCENELHQAYAKLRVRGEWFSLSTELRSYIAKIAVDNIVEGMPRIIEGAAYSCICGAIFERSQDKAIHVRRCADVIRLKEHVNGRN